MNEKSQPSTRPANTTTVRAMRRCHRMSTDPLVKTGRSLSRPELTRYARHVLLPDVGRDGQERLISTVHFVEADE